MQKISGYNRTPDPRAIAAKYSREFLNLAQISGEKTYYANLAKARALWVPLPDNVKSLVNLPRVFSHLREKAQQSKKYYMGEVNTDQLAARGDRLPGTGQDPLADNGGDVKNVAGDALPYGVVKYPKNQCFMRSEKIALTQNIIKLASAYNPERKFLRVTNDSATPGEFICLYFTGSPGVSESAFLPGGIRLDAGESWEPLRFVPINEIFAHTITLAGGNLTIVEG